jgi:hypothetical protein
LFARFAKDAALWHATNLRGRHDTVRNDLSRRVFRAALTLPGALLAPSGQAKNRCEPTAVLACADRVSNEATPIDEQLTKMKSARGRRQ